MHATLRDDPARDNPDRLVEPNVVFELPLPPDFMAALGKVVVHPARASEGDIVGMGASILRFGENIMPEDIHFLRATEARESPDQVLAEDLGNHPQASALFVLLGLFLRSSLDNLLTGDHFAMEESSCRDGYHYLGLSIFPDAVIIADSIHEAGYMHPDDLATTNALFLRAARSAHEVMARQPQIDAILDIFADLSITGDLAGRFDYGRVHLPQGQA